jgi:glycosyltransferase involved in cell wall biosynthesis
MEKHMEQRYGNFRETVLVAIREFGVPQQPWMRRQVAGMSLLDIRIMCWKHSGTKYHAIQEASVHTLEAECAPFDSKWRWAYRLANLSNGNFFAALGKERRELKKLIQAENPSSILCYYGDCALRLVDVAQELQVPLIAYFHGDFRFNYDRWYRWSLESRADQFAAVVVTNSQERAWMREHGVPDGNLHVIPCGAPTSVFLPKDERSPREIRFVMAHRLENQKGCKESILAFANVALQRRDVFLDVYGEGGERRNLEELVEARGLRNMVKFHGYVDEQTLATRLRECDIFIQHSFGTEGSPVSIVEAMSCGLPVVATAVGGIVDQVVNGSTGFIIAENDISAMSGAMLRLAGDTTLRKVLGQNGRERATELFDSSLLTGRLEQVILNTVVREKRAGLENLHRAISGVSA